MSPFRQTEGGKPSVSADDRLKLLAGAKHRDFAGRNFDFLTCLRIAALAGFTVNVSKGSKTHQGHFAITFLQF